eukprot:m51a1_g9348 hypothetical protein (244) ;mRNA; r:115200-116101
MDEEVQMEIEAMQAIYGDDCRVDPRSPSKLSVVIRPENGDSVELVFQLPSGYPNARPTVSARGSILQTATLGPAIEDEITRSLGSAMLYNVAQRAKDHIENPPSTAAAAAAAAPTTTIVEEEGSDSEGETEVAKERREELARAAKRREAGTPVTRENFMSWWAAFKPKLEARRAAEAVATATPLTAEQLKRRTGRQLFEADKSLVTSDAKFVDMALPDEESDDEKEARQKEREAFEYSTAPSS